ncbi:MAG: hypothetical protein J0J01_13355 [Reyranella sp.]|uniref:hypothetical protein n=1 Tax=Reyranella sp. TaxID=1929291 RepID=UPI001AC3146E|nr:hypothetical protein [Reyranella sp.]MBN9087892.1 hypothetical protein [Reyranella sp.]
MTRRAIAALIDRRRQAIGLAMKGAGAGVVAILLAGAAGPAAADPYCGGGRHVGSENDGAGLSWKCVPNGTPSARSTYSGNPVQNQRIAAGMALGAAGLDLVSALVGILGSRSGPSQAEIEAQERQRQWDAEYAARKAQTKAEAEVYAADGRSYAQAGNYGTAFDYFKRAYERSGDYEYLKDMKAMDALLHLQEALALTAEKQTAAAYTEFFKAKALATEAYRPDIADRIEAYRVKLFAGLADQRKTAPGAAKPTTKCVSVNGDFVCD